MSVVEWCPWCSGNTAACGAVISGSTPDGHPNMAHIHEKIDFVADVFIVYKDKVFLRMHDKLHVWLSVGGHIELDEATSSLDSLTEEEISKTMREISSKNPDASVGAGLITILIAHRLSTIMHADRIYVLEKGRVAETGTHPELLAKSGLYSAMWRQQIGERM